MMDLVDFGINLQLIDTMVLPHLDLSNSVGIVSKAMFIFWVFFIVFFIYYYYGNFVLRTVNRL